MEKYTIPQEHLKIQTVTLTPKHEHAGYEMNRDVESEDFRFASFSTPFSYEDTVTFNFRDWEMTVKFEPSDEWKRVRELVDSDELAERILSALNR